MRFYCIVATLSLLLFTHWLVLSPDETSSRMLSSLPRVFIDGSNIYNPTGGPEALVQLALALYTVLPHQAYIVSYKDTAIHWNVVDAIKKIMDNKTHYTEFIHPQFIFEYPPLASVPLGVVDDMIADDILILPEIWPCPEELVAKGIKVYMWVLGATPEAMKLSTSSCSILSHNFWLSRNFGVSVPATSILRPYITPSLLPQSPIDLSKKEDLILIDNDSPQDIVDSVLDFCDMFTCTAIVLRGFTREQLLPLYGRAKVVIDWCMRGTERMPVEAVLHGALLVSSACQCVQDRQDFPIPQRNIITSDGMSLDLLPGVLERVLLHYHDEYADYEQMRELYGRVVTSMSLQDEVLSWYNYHISAPSSTTHHYH